MKQYLLYSLIFIGIHANANNSVANAAAVAVTQSAVNTSMQVYWQGQGVQSNIVSLPNGTSYVIPETNRPSGTPATSGTPYNNQNNQNNKQAFIDEN
ncbi:MAG: hypothetical protein NTV32_09145 [Gammaproteobacteria bacterium]|jgi:hypothetical protein|nr:hypothetical protein [Gammaproteobacteria bacterium]